MPYRRVLFVDDVKTNLYVAEGFLSAYELSIELTVSGTAASEKVSNGEVYDTIFVDHMMPEMDGMGDTIAIISPALNSLAYGCNDALTKLNDCANLNVVPTRRST